MSEAQWYIQVAEGKKAGPISFERVRELAKLGKIKPSTRLRSTVEAVWLPAERVPGVFETEEAVASPGEFAQGSIFSASESPAEDVSEKTAISLGLDIDDASAPVVSVPAPKINPFGAKPKDGSKKSTFTPVKKSKDKTSDDTGKSVFSFLGSKKKDGRKDGRKESNAAADETVGRGDDTRDDVLIAPKKPITISVGPIATETPTSEKEAEELDANASTSGDTETEARESESASSEGPSFFSPSLAPSDSPRTDATETDFSTRSASTRSSRPTRGATTLNKPKAGIPYLLPAAGAGAACTIVASLGLLIVPFVPDVLLYVPLFHALGLLGFLGFAGAALCALIEIANRLNVLYELHASMENATAELAEIGAAVDAIDRGLRSRSDEIPRATEPDESVET